MGTPLGIGEAAKVVQAPQQPAPAVHGVQQALQCQDEADVPPLPFSMAAGGWATDN